MLEITVGGVDVRRWMAVTALVFVFAWTGRLGAQASAAGPLDGRTRTAVVEALAVQLERVYIFLDVGQRMGRDLKARAARGEYSEITDPEAFARLLTEQLQGVSHDKHLRVGVGLPQPPAATGPLDGGLPSPFGRVERLDGGVAYVELKTFMLPANAVRDEVARVMGGVADAPGLILDLRGNGGGRPELVTMVASYLFGDEPVLLNSLYFRFQDRTDDFYTDPKVKGAKYGPDKPVWVLVNGQTFSAAEEFTYDLQARKRAVVVGETTRGGANPGSPIPLPGGLMVVVPSGRAINPITKTNWDGVGVKPDIAVTAGKALDTALALARRRGAGRGPRLCGRRGDGVVFRDPAQVVEGGAVGRYPRNRVAPGTVRSGAPAVSE